MDDTARTEQKKYERIWQVPGYRSYSPGEKALSVAMQYFEPGGSIADFGCGTGRAARILQSKGFDVTGIDFAGNCLDPGVTIKFHQSCLWEIASDLLFDYGYCTDVMEHIPPRKVHATLKAIKEATRVGCFFQIATYPDRFGDTIGESLHLSVRPSEEWESALMKHWPHVNTISRGRNARFWVSH